ncbi:CoA transferase [Paracoccaceae bacterium]|jgi:2-methylfumaryl-CoA isomerase|nr:CoA transferase [Paracoccaceae bacterium]
MSILHGMRVFESSAFVALPLAGMQLAQMGAEVIRFDNLGGGLDQYRRPLAPNGESLFWHGLNKGKKSFAVNLKSEIGRELVSDLITSDGDDSGLFITNLRVPGWTDYESLKKKRKDLVMVTLKGDRHGGPEVDYTVNPSIGIPSITGAEDSLEPVANALPAWDCIAGNMVVSSLLAAERDRLRTGKGQNVEFALKDAAAAIVGHLGMIGEATISDEQRRKSGNSLYGAYGQDFECCCGGRVIVIGLTLRQWRGLLKAMDKIDEIKKLEEELSVSLDDEGRRWVHRHEINDIFRPWFAKRKIIEFEKGFNDLGLTWSQFRTMKEAIDEDDDTFADNPMFETQDFDGIGKYMVPRSPVEFSNHLAISPEKPPKLGQHTEEILADIMGLGSGEIGVLFDSGIVSFAK